MLEFEKENQLQLTAAGNSFLDADSGIMIGDRAINNSIVFSKASGLYIGNYHVFMRPVWAKLIPLDIVSKLDFSVYYNVRYGADTMFILDIVSHCNRFGIHKGILYNYYVNSKSDSHVWDERRIDSDFLLLKHGIEHCKIMTGTVSKDNYLFLTLVYLNAINDTIQVLLSSDEKISTKVEGIRKIVQNK